MAAVTGKNIPANIARQASSLRLARQTTPNAAGATRGGMRKAAGGYRAGRMMKRRGRKGR